MTSTDNTQITLPTCTVNEPEAVEMVAYTVGKSADVTEEVRENILDNLVDVGKTVECPTITVEASEQSFRTPYSSLDESNKEKEEAEEAMVEEAMKAYQEEPLPNLRIRVPASPNNTKGQVEHEVKACFLLDQNLLCRYVVSYKMLIFGCPAAL